MPSRSPAPVEREEPPYELPSYAGSSSHTQPLLHGPASPTASTSRLPRRPRPSRLAGARRALGVWWKAALALGLPVALIWAYGLLHPHVPGLPGLPTVKVETSSGKQIWSSTSTGKDGRLGAQYAANEGEGNTCRCGWTEAGKKLCELYHSESLLASRLHTGSEARLKRKLKKAREGQETFKIGLLGGSVSACHGLHPTPDFPQGDPKGPGCYSSLLVDWFEETFPKVCRAVVCAESDDHRQTLSWTMAP